MSPRKPVQPMGVPANRLGHSDDSRDPGPILPVTIVGVGLTPDDLANLMAGRPVLVPISLTITAELRLAASDVER